MLFKKKIGNETQKIPRYTIAGNSENDQELQKEFDSIRTEILRATTNIKSSFLHIIFYFLLFISGITFFIFNAYFFHFTEWIDIFLLLLLWHIFGCFMSQTIELFNERKQKKCNVKYYAKIIADHQNGYYPNSCKLFRL